MSLGNLYQPLRRLIEVTYSLLLIISVFFTVASAGDYWHLENGGSSMKILSIQGSPREAAMAGSGVATPRSAAEALRNPLATAAVSSSTLNFSKINFSNKVGASHIAMVAHTPLSVLGGLHLSAGLESLNYDPIQGYNEDGLTADNLEFGSGTVAAQIGVAKEFKQSVFGISARYASQNIDYYYYQGVLFDGGAKLNAGDFLTFGAIFTNFGFLTDGETAPLAVQAGITASHSLPLDLNGSLSADLYRRNDQTEQWRLGGELSYKEFFAVRLGYPISKNSSDNDALSAGFAVAVSFVSVEYAYQNRTALGANHIFGIGLKW
ncbi:hypothetical protein AGMMS49938_10330 [Fibrobacterales bacterium]|nr:hypothetical protein AGMMS49938_10330 [Fibrobacterales bacterium]